MIIIMTVVIAAVAVILLQEASNISVKLSIRSLRNMTGQRAEFWKGREEGYLQLLRGLAEIMGEYESVPAGEHRDMYDDMLQDILKNNTNFVRMFSIWKPNAIDGMDSRYIGRPGSTATEQYAMTPGAGIQGRLWLHPTSSLMKLRLI
jgi:methyl-accepting chemotaxis protein